MSFIKENLLTGILVILIIITILGIIIFFWNFIQSENETSNTIIAENYNQSNQNLSNNEIVENIDTENTNEVEKNSEEKYNEETKHIDIDMSEYYLDTTYGRVAEIYNNMLDSLGKQKCIIGTSNGSDCLKSTIDLNKMCFLNEYEDFYECWAYVRGLEKKYKYVYSTGEVENETENSIWMKSNADFVAFALNFEITDDDYIWEYEYNEDISRNGYQCYEIIAKWNGDYIDYSGETIRWDGINKLYIDMENYNLIENENTFYLNDTIGYKTYSNFYEYLDADLQIPEEAENYIFLNKIKF